MKKAVKIALVFIVLAIAGLMVFLYFKPYNIESDESSSVDKSSYRYYYSVPGDSETADETSNDIYFYGK